MVWRAARELEPVKVQARRSHSVPLWYYNSGLVRANPFKPTRVMKMIFTRPHAKEKVLARTVGSQGRDFSAASFM